VEGIDMPDLLPAQWKETLERIKDKAGRFLDKFTQTKHSGTALESITEDQLPAFMQLGGPPLDMHESADELVVTAEVPGLTKDDLTIELVGTRLMIRGEKKVSREQKGSGGSYLSECSYGSFARSVQLPYDIKEGKIKADLKNGLLTIRMPKPDSGKKGQHKVTIS
jgi:HSP20 family protein